MCNFVSGHAGNTTIRKGKDFRPSFGALKNLRAFVPSGAPMLATTATVTTAMRNDIIEKLDMAGCCVLTESPNKPNITYEVVRKNTMHTQPTLTRVFTV
eukprot:Em0223g4a